MGFALLVTTASPARAVVLSVKLLVDDEETMTRSAWQRRLKDRLDQASHLINQYGNVQFAVVEYATWNSDRRVNDLNRSLREFEQEVDPSPADVAIGFSSQYRFQRGVNGLGGTRGPLHTHILLRESSPTTMEPERLEALIHELGHYMGAAHSASQESVMRPIIGDGRVRGNGFQIGFDQYNARIIRLVGNEMAVLGVRRFQDLSDLTKKRLVHHYQDLAKELPNDPAAPHFIRIMNRR